MNCQKTKCISNLSNETDVMLYPGRLTELTIPAKIGQNWKTWKESVYTELSG